MSLEERSARRRRTMKSHRAMSFAEAERWDLLFWQEQSPEDRMSALVAIRNDIKKVEDARAKQES